MFLPLGQSCLFEPLTRTLRQGAGKALPEMRQQHDSARFSLCEAPQAALMRGFPGSSARTGLQRQAEIIRRPLTLQKLMLGLALRRPCPAARPKVRMPHCRNSLSAKEEDPLQGQLCVNRLLHSRCFPYRGLPGKNRPCRMFLRLCPMSPSGRGARKNSIFAAPVYSGLTRETNPVKKPYRSTSAA